MLGLLLGLPGAALPITVTWDFSSGLDTTNFTYATNSNVTLTDTGGELQLTKPAISSGGLVQSGLISSNFSLQGDFDVQVDYKINATPLNNGVQIQLNMTGTSPFFAMIRSNEWGQNYHVWRDPPGCWYGSVSTTDNQGILRVSRTGNTATFYFYDTVLSDWHLIYTDTGFGTANRQFSLSAQDNFYVNGTPVSFDVSFDNLRVTAAALPGYVPVPPSLVLLGSGLVALACWRRRQS